MLGRAVEPKAGEVGADGHTHERNCLNCGTLLAGEFCHACGQQCARPPHAYRLLPRPASRRAAFRRQDLAHPAAAGVEAGRTDPALYRRRAGQVRLADRAVPVQRLPDVRGASACYGGTGELPAKAKQGQSRKRLRKSIKAQARRARSQQRDAAIKARAANARSSTSGLATSRTKSRRSKSVRSGNLDEHAGIATTKDCPAGSATAIKQGGQATRNWWSTSSRPTPINSAG